MKRILLSGATGLIGSALIEHLDSRHAIDVITTRPEQARQRFGNQRRYYSWSEISDHGERILAGYNLVVNLAGAPIISRWSPENKRAIRQSRAGLTTLLARKLAQTGQASRMINASSTYIYGYHPDINRQNETVFDEYSAVDQYRTDNFIVNVCRDWERSVEPLDGTRVTILRIGVVLSSRGGVLPEMLRYARLGLGGKVGTGRQPFPWVSLVDATRAIAFIIDHEDLHGPVNIVAPQDITQGEAGTTISEIVKRPSLLGMPAVLIRMLYREMGVQTTLNGPQVHPRVLLAAGFEFEDTSVREAVVRTLDEAL